MRRLNLFTIILIFLFAVGLVSAIISSFSKIIIPVIIFGLLYLFYKYPNGLRGIWSRITKGKPPTTRNGSSTIIDGKFKEINKDK